MINPKEYFEHQIASAKRKLKLINKMYKVISWGRSLYFLFWIFLCYSSFNYAVEYLLSILMLGFGIFMAIIQYHKTFQDKRNYFIHLVKINTQELSRIEGDYSDIYNGSRYNNPKHLYATDLDIFGPHSIYQNINRTILHGSQNLLAKYLCESSSPNEVLLRQGSVAELVKNIDWVQSFRAKMISAIGTNTTDEDFNLNQKVKKITNHSKYASIILPFIAIPLFIAWLADAIPFTYLLGSVVINGLFLYQHQYKIKSQGIDLDKSLKGLNIYAVAFSAINELKAKNEILFNNWLSVSSAMTEIKKLSQLAYFQDSRSNQFYWILNLLVLLDLHLWVAITKWTKKNHNEFQKWIDIVHQTEVLNSMAVFAFTNPNFIYPKIYKEGTILRCINVGHPLIQQKKCIPNNFWLEDEKVVLITGSNMAGKSTFLRTIGLNAVLAWTGLPVRAKEFEISDFMIFTSMRTQDDLSDNTSSFYAELKRIKLLLDTLENSNKPVLYFLDEILKGTNSKDRYKGGKGLIEQLKKRNAIGFISTHDLELANEYIKDKMVKNYHFESLLVHKELIFDYKLHPGICISTNATELMRKIGIFKN